MKTLRTLSFILILCILASLASPLALALGTEAPELGAQSALLLELETNQIFYEKHPDLRVYPASLTKIMTLLLVVEAIDEGTFSLYDKVTAKEGKDTDLEHDSESILIRTGEVMTLENLIYCAMLASSNAACNIIAEYIAGSVPAFLEQMNARAKALGCTGTNFVNVHGLHNEEHYTTAEDLALIAREAVSHTLFLEICNTVTYSVPATNYAPVRSLKTTNHLINKDSGYAYYYEGASGVKTGFTSAAGHCLVSTATRDGIRLLSIVTGCTSKKSGNRTTSIGSFEDTIALYDWAFSNYSYQYVLTSDEIIATVPVKMGSGADEIALRPRGAISALLPNDTDLAQFHRDVSIFSVQNDGDLTAPIPAGTVLGQMTVSQGDTVYGTVSLVAATSVDLSKLAYLESRLAATASDHRVRLIVWILAGLALIYLLLVIRYRFLRMRYILALRRQQRAEKVAPVLPIPLEPRPAGPPVPPEVASFEEIFAPPKAAEKKGVTALLGALTGKLKARPAVPALTEAVPDPEPMAEESVIAPAEPEDETLPDETAAAPTEEVHETPPEPEAAPAEIPEAEAPAPEPPEPEVLETAVPAQAPDDSFLSFAMDRSMLEKLSAPIWTLGTEEETEEIEEPQAPAEPPAPVMSPAEIEAAEAAAREAAREKAERDYFEEFFRKH